MSTETKFPFQSFETERLIMQPSGMEDVDFLIELMNMPKWIEFIGDRNVRTIEESKVYLAQKIIKDRLMKGVPNFTILRKSDKVKMGKVGLVDRDGLEHMDIGFSFLPEYEGKGYAYESSIKVIEIARDIMGLKKLCAITMDVNFGSQGLLKKLGFTHTKLIHLNDGPEELMYFEKEI